MLHSYEDKTESATSFDFPFQFPTKITGTEEDTEVVDPAWYPPLVDTWTSTSSSTSSDSSITPRHLHSKIKIIEGDWDGTQDENIVENMTWEYHPDKLVLDMHHAPRFGHSNHIGTIASINVEDQIDYLNGIKSFLIFLLVPFIFWGALLLLFKYAYGTEKVGCAAGGGVIDLVKLSEQGVRRKRRKERIYRSWKLQTSFLLAAVLVPIATGVLIKIGLRQLEEALNEVRDLNDDVESLAFRGLNIITSLEKGRTELLGHLSALLPPSAHSSDTFELSSKTWCPNMNPDDQTGNTTSPLAQFDTIMDTVGFQVDDIVTFLNKQVGLDPSGLIMVTDATDYLDRTIDWAFSHDWILKLFLMALNVVNLFLLCVCRFLSKNNVVHVPTRFFTATFVLPLFIGLTTFITFAMATSTVATLANADFCAGGSGQGSPQGSIEDAILYHRYGTIERDFEEDFVAYEAFKYFATGCITENPLDYLGQFQFELDQTLEWIELLSSSLNVNDDQTLFMLSAECGSDLVVLKDAMEKVVGQLKIIATNFHELVDISSCHKISPIIRRITHGSLCQESVYGITCIWGALLAISILCFIMLTTRAAVFNSVITKRKRNGKRRKQRPEKVEKEFEEYKNFMSEYFDDADTWVMRPVKKKVTGEVEIEIAPELMAHPTFETEATRTLSGESDQVFDDRSGTNDSEYTDDSSESEEDDDDDDYNDGLSSFISETKSVAKQTIDALRVLPSMLGAITGRDDPIMSPSAVPSMLGGAFSPEVREWSSDSNCVDGDRPLSPEEQEQEPLYRTPPIEYRSPTTGSGLDRRKPTTQLFVGTNSSSKQRHIFSAPETPQKAFMTFGRTKKNEIGLKQLKTPSQSSRNVAPAENEFCPRQLEMSPMLSPPHTSPLEVRSTSRQRASRVAKPSTPSKPLQDLKQIKPDKARGNTGSSQIETIPDRPKKVIRHLNRLGT